MTEILPVLRMRRRQRRLGSRSRSVSGLGCSAFLSLVVAGAALAATLLYAGLTRDLPPPEALPALLEPPGGALLQPTRFYDRTGERALLTLAPPGTDARQYRPLAGAEREPQDTGFPPELVAATVVASDPSFWRHPGFTLAGLLEGEQRTLAQQLVASLLLWEEPPGLRRAVRERLLAGQITHKYGREKVMEWFLNAADYGNLAYGAEAAAGLYLGKPAADLTLAESAVLAAVAEAPALNPHDTPEEATARQRELLKEMLESGQTTTALFRSAINEELSFARATPAQDEPFAGFVELVVDRLAGQISRERLELGGLRVVTTLDAELQLQVDCVVRSQLARLAGEDPPDLTFDGTTCTAAQLLPSLPAATRGSFPSLTAGAVLVDTARGQVLAFVASPALDGGDPGAFPARSPGSLLAPYVHLAAYTRGLGPGSLGWDIPSAMPPALEAVGLQEGMFQGPVRLRTALANDILIPTLALLEQIGPENVWRSIPQLGLNTLDIPADQGAYRVMVDEGRASLLELTHAYSVFSNQGVLLGAASAPVGLESDGPMLQAAAVLRVETQQGQTWIPEVPTESRPVISAQLSYLIHDVLSDEIARWPSLGHPNPFEIGRPAGVKAGRTLDGQDTWALGYTPQLVGGVWVGATDQTGGPSDLERASPGDKLEGSAPIPGEAAAGVWHALIQHASRDLPAQDWEQPPGVSRLDVCDPSGLLPTAECPEVVSEIFLNGNEPTQADNLFQSIEINRETGRLATIFTPPELVEERVYLVVPPEAAAWAAESGLPTPPEDYDLIFAPGATQAEVRIETPEMFAYVGGEVTIRGSASGAGFDFYRLQIGQGLNPQSWLQLGDDRSRAVTRGFLGSWDTVELQGLYAVQLLVVRTDQRIDTATVQVTVDNQPPVIEILNPTEGGLLAYPEDRVVTLHARADDDLALAQVEFYLDGELLETLTTPPFAIPRSLLIGQHTLRVEASDRAGNTAEAVVQFELR